MRVQFMKDIDRWAGGLGCIVLDVLDRPRRWLVPRPQVPDHVKTILVTKYLGMGSLVLATPMVAALRQRFPEARIVLLTFESSREIATILNVFDEIYTIDANRLTTLARDSLRTLFRLRRLGVDIVCDLEFFTRFSTMIGYLSGAPIRVGYWSRIAWRGNLLTHPVYYNGMRHITRVFLAQAEVLGAEVEEQTTFHGLTRLARHAEAEGTLMKRISASGLDPDKPFLIVNPNTSELCLERRWMPDRFATIIDSLLAEHTDLQALLVGDESQGAYTEQVLDGCREKARSANLAGKLTLRELLEALSAARLFLTVDSGPLHLAALTDTPTIALFGPETPSLYGSLGRGHRIFYAGVYCSPCLNIYNSKTAPCNGNNICMQAIPASDVLVAARELLGDRALERSTGSRDEHRRVPSLSQ